MKLFQAAAPATSFRSPLPTALPDLAHSEVAALYRAARIGGDFYDFFHVSPTKLIFLLLDIAGKRERALHVAAETQGVFRVTAQDLYREAGMEDADAVTRLVLELNRTIMSAAGGVCHTPAFLGCYDEEIGTLSYINAGHIPGVLKDDQGTLLLEANGLPLGLFSHSTHDSQFCAICPGAVLLLASKGVVEVRGGHDEFGIERLQNLVAETPVTDAKSICEAVLAGAEKHQMRPTHFGPGLRIPGFGHSEPNDMTALALYRRP